jgi:hypothetical protein
MIINALAVRLLSSVHNYNLHSMEKKSVNFFTFKDKVDAFFSDKHPIEMVVIKIHLDPDNKDYHNVGIPDLKSSFGIMYTDQWFTERVSVIMDKLINSRERDLILISNDIRDHLTEEGRIELENKLGDIMKVSRPRNDRDLHYRNVIIAYLKKDLYNKRELALEAKRNTIILDNDTDCHNIDYTKILKGGITIEEASRIDKENKQQIAFNKEQAIYLFDHSPNHHRSSVLNLINNETDIEWLKIIIRLLTRSWYSDVVIDNNSIQEQIRLDTEIFNLI